MDENLSMSDFLKDIDASMKRIHEGDILEGRVLSVSEEEIAVSIGYITDGVIPKGETNCMEEENLIDFIGDLEIIPVMVLAINNGEGNVLLSMKKAVNVKTGVELKEAYENGHVIEVTVKEAVKGGVVCDINGVRAFIPLSQLSLKYVEDSSEFVSKDLKVKVIEYSDDKVILSHKEVLKEEEKRNFTDKWNDINNFITEGQITNGKVTKIMDFGVFVRLDQGLEGLLHKSRVSEDRNPKLNEKFKEGQDIEVKIEKINKKNKKISLDLVKEKEEKVDYEIYNSKEEDLTLGELFKDKFKDFKF